MRRTVRISSDRWLVLALLATLLGGSSPLVLADRAAGGSAPDRRNAAASPLALRSRDLTPGAKMAPAQVYDGSGCHGGNISPALSWDHAPTGTRSFAVLMFDGDAPGGGFWHWVVFDIPAEVSGLRAGAGAPEGHLLPPGAIQGRNDWGSVGYGGPCPPAGPPHHYRLILYALRAPRLGLDASASAAQIEARARAEALARAEIVGLYGR